MPLCLICCMQSASMETTETTVAATLPDDSHWCPRPSPGPQRRGVAWRLQGVARRRQLLLWLRSLLPHSVRGLFINYEAYASPHFFSRPPRIHGMLNRSWYQVMDHCNGLVLYTESYGRVLHVCNPTTQWSAQLPRWPDGDTCCYSTLFSGRRAFLVFDPFVSPEYKVLLPPHEPGRKQVMKDDAFRLMEWPPSPWKLWFEFSSGTGRWEEKAFVREGEAAGTAADLLLNQGEWGCPVEPQYSCAAYWQGALYVHCRGEYVSRFSLLEDKYRVIKSPIQLAHRKNNVRSFLGRSEKGVYIAAIASVGFAKLRVWTLTESGDQMEWVPKDQSNLKINTRTWLFQKKKLDKTKFWILDLGDNEVKNQEVSSEQNVCWNSDDDNIMDISGDEEGGPEYIKFLGFHPYKEVIFLYAGGYAVAVHLNSPKVQHLGSVDLPGTYSHGVRQSFVFTPCLIGH